jgi:hypothetical protein
MVRVRRQRSRETRVQLPRPPKLWSFVALIQPTKAPPTREQNLTQPTFRPSTGLAPRSPSKSNGIAGTLLVSGGDRPLVRIDAPSERDRVTLIRTPPSKGALDDRARRTEQLLS